MKRGVRTHGHSALGVLLLVALVGFGVSSCGSTRGDKDTGDPATATADVSSRSSSQKTPAPVAGGAAHGVAEASGTQTAGAPPAPPGPTATVVGTAVDAASGERLAGVRVLGPDGLETRTDASGRFELAGLPLGWRGPLLAEGPGGLKASLRLRPLTAGRLEVVVRLSDL